MPVLAREIDDPAGHSRRVLVDGVIWGCAEIPGETRETRRERPEMGVEKSDS